MSSHIDTKNIIEKNQEPFNDYYRNFPHGPCENNFQCGGAYVCSLSNELCNSNYEDMRCSNFKSRKEGLQ